MTEGKIQAAIGISVVAVTKYLMEHFAISYEEAYKKLMDTEFFELLNDVETGLYLEPSAYLCEACLLEIEQGSDAMHDYICLE